MERGSPGGFLRPAGGRGHRRRRDRVKGDGMDLIFPDWTDAPANVGAFSTLRTGGVSHAPYDDGAGGGGLNLGVHVGDDLDRVHCNRALVRALLPDEPAWLSQVHGARVLNAAAVIDAPEADASIATQAGSVCVIQTADCLPVLF